MNRSLEGFRCVVECRICTLNEIFALRARVLRLGRPPSTASFEVDLFPETTHFGAFLDDKAVACLTLHVKANEAQLRGMAVDLDFRRRQIGSELLDWAEDWCRGRLIGSLWCNARLEAVPFYEGNGWRTKDSLFWVSGIGPHFRMEKEIL